MPLKSGKRYGKPKGKDSPASWVQTAYVTCASTFIYSADTVRDTLTKQGNSMSSAALSKRVRAIMLGVWFYEAIVRDCPAAQNTGGVNLDGAVESSPVCFAYCIIAKFAKPCQAHKAMAIKCLALLTKQIAQRMSYDGESGQNVDPRCTS